MKEKLPTSNDSDNLEKKETAEQKEMKNQFTVMISDYQDIEKRYQKVCDEWFIAEMAQPRSLNITTISGSLDILSKEKDQKRQDLLDLYFEIQLFDPSFQAHF